MKLVEKFEESSKMKGAQAVLAAHLIVAAVIAAVPLTIAAPHPSLLTFQQQAKLRSLGIKIAVPGDVPAGFSVAKVQVEPCPVNFPRSKTRTCGFGPAYGIIYRDNQNTCFAIEATGGGIGGPAYDYSFPVMTRLFGEAFMQFGQNSDKPKLPSQQQLVVPQQNLFMDWGGAGPFYRFIGADFVRTTYYGERVNQPVSQCRHDITPETAAKIVRSLTWLN